MNQDENKENQWESLGNPQPAASDPDRGPEKTLMEAAPPETEFGAAAGPEQAGPAAGDPRPPFPPFQPQYPADSPYSQPFYNRTPFPSGRQQPGPSGTQAQGFPPESADAGMPGMPEPMARPPKKHNPGLAAVLAILAVSFVGSMGWLIGIGMGNLSGGGGGSELLPPSSSGQEVPEEGGAYVPEENPDAPVVQIAESPESPAETAPQADGTYTPRQIYTRVSPSVVSITVYQQGGVQRIGYGSGVILSEDGYIVTNAHVLTSSRYRFVVQTSDGRDYEAEFVAASTRYDLGVLKVDASGLTPAQFGNSDEVSVGDEVYGIGNPAGPDYASSLSHGLISGVNRSVTLEGYNNAYYLQTDAAINPGNSGGALINAYGQVIGISNSKVAGEDYEGMGFAIPTAQAIPLVNEMMRYGKLIDRVKIGVTFLELDENRASIAGLPEGLYVNSIEEESGAKGSGIEAGDVVTKAEGESCRTVDDLRGHLKGKKAGDVLTLEYYDASDGGRIKTAEVRLIEDVDSAFYG